MVIVGPCFDSVFHASQPPMAIATSGMIQITGNRRERRVVACTGAGGLGRSLIAGLSQRSVERRPGWSCATFSQAAREWNGVGFIAM